jgi:multidrug efflux pump subunit AcrA (membrane-fusion protein)
MKFSDLFAIVSTRAVLSVAATFALHPADKALAETKSIPGAQVTVVRATNACFSATIRVNGFLVPREEAIVTLDLPGLRVVEVLANEGDRVTAGQTLVRLARQTGEGADAGAAARAPTTLRSPVAGTVTRTTAAVGAVASPLRPEPLFRIVVDNEIELEAEVPSIHVTQLNPGQTVRIEIEDGRELTGRVRLAPAEVNQQTQLGRARISLGREAPVRIGLFARATIDAERSCGISIPRGAVRYRTEGPSVQIVRDGLIETRRIQVGLHSDTDVEIRNGLRQADVVVANAGTSLRDGDKVSAILADGSQIGQR